MKVSVTKMTNISYRIYLDEHTQSLLDSLRTLKDMDDNEFMEQLIYRGFDAMIMLHSEDLTKLNVINGSG